MKSSHLSFILLIEGWISTLRRLRRRKVWAFRARANKVCSLAYPPSPEAASPP